MLTRTRETVRSGRKANFYITENSFIDHYARDVGPVGIAVYHILERYMNCETRSTWVGTAKMAELLGMSQRSVQRHLKTLEDLKLIRILRTASMTTYVVMPVPPRHKAATIPLFDKLEDQAIPGLGDMDDAFATPASHEATPLTYSATSASHRRDTHDAPNKEEQDLLNKTSEQEGPSSFPSMQRIAGRLANMVGLPLTPGNLRSVEAAVVAEANRNGWSTQESARFIAEVAMDDMRKGVLINKFYFEDAKWRPEGRNYGKANRAEQRKLDNLEVNARFQQRLKERFGHP